MNNSILKTGPKTLAGKKRSAQNAIKSGVYATKLLSGEVHEYYKEMRNAMIEDFEAYDALGLSAVEEVVMTYVRKNRIINAETKYLAGVMQTEEARDALCEKLYGNKSLSRVTPWWYLEIGPCMEKRKADVIHKALEQIAQLKERGGYQTDQGLAFSYTELNQVVMWYRINPNEKFAQTLSAITGKPDMATALLTFDKKLREKFVKHIEWAQNADRYQRVVEMVYAEFAMRVMSRPEMIKLTNALNRQTEHALNVLYTSGRFNDEAQAALPLQAVEGHINGAQQQLQIEAPQGEQSARALNAGSAGAVQNATDAVSKEGDDLHTAAPKNTDAALAVAAETAALVEETGKSSSQEPSQRQHKTDGQHAEPGNPFGAGRQEHENELDDPYLV